jgi:nucleotide-binding universal stress UspA family protein
MSDLKSILVHLDGSAHHRVRLQTAQALAQSHGAALEAVYAVMPAHLMYPYIFSAESAVAAQMAVVLEEQRKHQDQVLKRLKAAAAGMPGLKWQATTADPLRGFVQHSWAADLLVLAQPNAEDSGFAGVDDDFVPSALIDSGKPGLVLPSAFKGPLQVDTVLLAWKPSPGSARACAAALPWLRQAKHVHVVTWAEPGLTDASTAQGIEAWLAHHGVHAMLHQEAAAKADMGELLLAKAAKLKADLLVMGCYGHSRAREWLLGGATRTVLKSMKLPVLMAH